MSWSASTQRRLQTLAVKAEIAWIIAWFSLLARARYFEFCLLCLNSTLEALANTAQQPSSQSPFQLPAASLPTCNSAARSHGVASWAFSLLFLSASAVQLRLPHVERKSISGQSPSDSWFRTVKMEKTVEWLESVESDRRQEAGAQPQSCIKQTCNRRR